jgi:antitoxin (DNA-binding transcriptional repressor) of toxin-antitoxin stability system
METVSIRDLRGSDLRARALKGEPFAITKHRLLIGVVVPVAVGWVEHLIDQNWSRVQQSIAQGEQAMADGTPMVTLESAMAEADAADLHQRPGPDAPRRAERLAVPLAAVAVSGKIARTPGAKEIIERLQAVLTLPGSAAGQETGPAEPSVRTVRIGDLSAGVIEQAGTAGQTLALTNNGELIGIVIPVTQDLVQFLLEQNMSRVLLNIVQDEGQLSAGDKLTTLDEALREADREADRGGDTQPSPPLTADYPQADAVRSQAGARQHC